MGKIPPFVSTPHFVARVQRSGHVRICGYNGNQQDGRIVIQCDAMDFISSSQPTSDLHATATGFTTWECSLLGNLPSISDPPFCPGCNIAGQLQDE